MPRETTALYGPGALGPQLRSAPHRTTKEGPIWPLFVSSLWFLCLVPVTHFVSPVMVIVALRPPDGGAVGFSSLGSTISSREHHRPSSRLISRPPFAHRAGQPHRDPGEVGVGVVEGAGRGDRDLAERAQHRRDRRIGPVPGHRATATAGPRPSRLRPASSHGAPSPSHSAVAPYSAAKRTSSPTRSGTLKCGRRPAARPRARSTGIAMPGRRAPPGRTRAARTRPSRRTPRVS